MLKSYKHLKNDKDTKSVKKYHVTFTKHLAKKIKKSVKSNQTLNAPLKSGNEAMEYILVLYMTIMELYFPRISCYKT